MQLIQVIVHFVKIARYFPKYHQGGSSDFQTILLITMRYKTDTPPDKTTSNNRFFSGTS